MLVAICERSWFATNLAETLRKAGKDLNIVLIDEHTLEVNESERKQIQVLITNRFQFRILPELCAKLPNLLWVHSNAAGCNELFMPQPLFPTAPKWTLTRAGGFLGCLVAEYVLGQVIAHQRNFAHFAKCQKESLWETDPKYVATFQPLSQLKIGILGAGSLGQAVSWACRSLKMTTIGIARSDQDQEKMNKFDHYFTVDHLAEALHDVDYVCSVLPCTAQTNNLLGNQTLKACTKNPVLINAGRGNVIKEKDLLRALKEKWIGGAILDCFETEPLPKDSLLWNTPNVVITPHVSARNIPEQSTQLFLDNLDLFNKGKPLKYVVNWDSGY